MRDDRGDIVIGWLTRIAAVMAVLGVLGFEAVSLGLARLSVQDVANDAAREAAQHYRQHGNVQQAYAEAVSVAERHEARIEPEEFRVEADGTIVLTAHKTATSMICYRFDRTKGWIEASAEARSRFSA